MGQINQPHSIALQNNVSPGAAPRFRYLPLFAALSYLTGSYIIFLMSSLATETPNIFLLSFYISAYIIAFAIGYSLRIARSSNCLNWHPTIHAINILRLLLLLGVIYQVITSATRVWRYSDPSTTLAESISNPGASYINRRAVESEIFQGDISMSVENALYWCSFMMVPAGVVLWPRLKRLEKAAFTMVSIVYLLSFVSIGTNKGIGDFILQFCSGLAIRKCSLWQPPTKSTHTTIRFVIVLTIAILVTGIYLSYNFLDRQHVRGNVGKLEITNADDSAFSHLLGNELGYGANMLVNVYLINGYEGMGCALGVPFQWTYGIGNSFALTSFAQQYFGVDLWSQTYLSRSEAITGWPALSLWSTMYTWLASDFSFPGVIIVMAIFGWVYAATWVRAVQNCEPLAIICFSLCIIQIGFVPANNQLLHMRGSCIGTILLFTAFLFSGLRNSRSLPITRLA